MLKAIQDNIFKQVAFSPTSRIFKRVHPKFERIFSTIFSVFRAIFARILSDFFVLMILTPIILPTLAKWSCIPTFLNLPLFREILVSHALFTFKPLWVGLTP